MGLISKNLVAQNVKVQPRIAEFISSTSIITGTSFTVTTTSLPASTAVGDVMLAVYAQQQNGGGNSWWTPPAGWTELLDYGGIISGISTRTVGAGDAGFTWTSLTPSPISFVQVSFRGVAIDVIGTLSAQADHTATVTVPSITTSVNNCIVLLFIICSDNFKPPSQPAGFTLRASAISQQAASSRPCVFVYMRGQAVAGATGTVSTSYDTFGQSTMGIQISLRPI